MFRIHVSTVRFVGLGVIFSQSAMWFDNDSGSGLENENRIDAPELMWFSAIRSVTTKGVTSPTGTSTAACNCNDRFGVGSPAPTISLHPFPNGNAERGVAMSRLASRFVGLSLSSLASPEGEEFLGRSKSCAQVRKELAPPNS